ncbi:hypothetical protein [Nonomuraea sp. CA-141351]|uniref:hypothetical protein n=1 Tax=Nonomuraea sp. CA-141351 TaxID=3239996 RepID=UPI003D8B3F89
MTDIAADVAAFDRRGRDKGATEVRALWEGPETGPKLTLPESKVDAILALLRTFTVYTATDRGEPFIAVCDDVREYLCRELGAAQDRADKTRKKRNPAATTTGFRIDPAATDQRTNNMKHSTQLGGGAS